MASIVAKPSCFHDVFDLIQILPNTYFIRAMACVFGKPSAAMSKELSGEEKEREAQQAKHLGEEGLAKLETTLANAMSENEHPIPADILTSLPIPDLEKVRGIPLFTARLSPLPDAVALEVVEESVRDMKSEDAEDIVAGLKGDSDVPAVCFNADLTNIDR